MANQIEHFLARILNFYSQSIRNTPILSAISLIALSALSYLPYYFAFQRQWRTIRLFKRLFRYLVIFFIVSFILIKCWQYLPIEAFIHDSKNKWQEFKQ